MSKPYVPPYPFVEVIWDDAVVCASSWVTLDDTAKPERVITRGWLVRAARDHVVVAGSVAGEAVENETVGGAMTIPKGMIVSRRVLRIAPAARKRKVS